MALRIVRGRCETTSPDIYLNACEGLDNPSAREAVGSIYRKLLTEAKKTGASSASVSENETESLNVLTFPLLRFETPELCREEVLRVALDEINVFLRENETDVELIIEIAEDADEFSNRKTDIMHRSETKSR